MQVIELGAKPIIGDCSMILHAALRGSIAISFLEDPADNTLCVY